MLKKKKPIPSRVWAFFTCYPVQVDVVANVAYAVGAGVSTSNV